jgi:SEC-C motif-containing protein
MRSRYSAYVLALEPYLLATWHASTRPSSLELQQAPARIHWLGLRVLRAQTQAPGRAVVEFVTRNRVGGASAVRSREISRFVREDGAWYYVDSVFPVAEASQ